MPELPEVETVKRHLFDNLNGYVIASYRQNRPNLRYPLCPSISENVSGCTIIDIRRRAKYVEILLDNGYSILLHLGMSGRVKLLEIEADDAKHDHVLFYFDAHNIKLVYEDARRFGMVYCMPTDQIDLQPFISNNGPEPLSDGFNAHYLQSALTKKKQPIKSALMDNRIVVGVGNIYASESLFLAGISPTSPANMLPKDAYIKLVKAIKDTLTKAIAAGGTTFRDFVSSDGSLGYFAQKLNVYGRDGKGCRLQSCSGQIIKITQQGRATFYCPICQK